MSFKNPSVKTLNTEKIEEKIEELKKMVDSNNSISEEILNFLKKNLSGNLTPVKEEIKKSEITYIRDENIPKSIEANEGMQRVLNIDGEKIQNLKDAFLSFNDQSLTESNLKEDFMGTEEAIVPMKL